MNKMCSNIHAPINCDEMIALFHEANAKFISQNVELFTTEVSERTLCGALMIAMNSIIRKGFERLNRYKNYFVDVEYNRNGGKIKTIINDDMEIIPINCDLIVHSRGRNKWQDNLIAIEMKKATRPESEKQSDRKRLIALTLPTDGVWSADGMTLPERVCGYVLGIYYEIDIRKMAALIEFYSNGKKLDERIIDIVDTKHVDGPRI
ncbi:hypothetical protein [Clostridium sp. JN-1]|uniref:hypothetical protein n=1 Tax=Clostridium sp. JN-1 TaxID=2483110 RepID=UPI00168024CB|nr:hypothetical protein [Clostridium sp. JN-1]